jgi:hypothetical protein
LEELATSIFRVEDYANFGRKHYRYRERTDGDAAEACLTLLL